MNLQAQQQALQQAILGRNLPPQLLTQGSEPRLAVYAHAYRARLLGALRDNYEVLAMAMGDAAFDALGRAYIEAHPSPHASIRWFGDGLVDFMAGAYAHALPHPALIDLARMDWALRGAFDAAAAPVLHAADLQAIAPDEWPGLCLRLQPAVRLLPLQWAVGPVWRALRQHVPGEGEEPELPEPAALAHQLLVWRVGLETRWRSLDALEAGLLLALQDGANFAALCEQAAGHVGGEGAAAAVVQALHRWLAEELLVT